VVFELFLQDLGILATEKNSFIESTNTSRDIDNVGEETLTLVVVKGVYFAGAQVVNGEIRFEARECPKHDDRVEVDILKSLWVRSDAVDEAIQVWPPFASLLVEGLMTNMRRDTRMKARDDTIINSLLQALLIGVRIRLDVETASGCESRIRTS
jgi:hypothetical protein